MKKIYNNKILQIFMILQPIIDIITSIMINEYHLSLSLGMIVRFGFLIYALGYLFKNNEKKINIYIGIWVVYILINLIGNFIIKDNFNLITQIIWLVKMFYFPTILLFWLIYFKNNKELDKKTFIYIAVLIGLSLVISCFTKTAYCTYSSHEDCYNDGIVAWFNSANEYGLILICLLGFSIIEFLKKENIYNILALLLTITFLCILGTKTSYVGVLGVISLYVTYYLFTCFFDIKKSKYIKKVVFLTVIVFVIGISTSNLPIYANLVDNYSRSYSEATLENCDEYCEYKTEDEVKEEITQNLVFNGRDDFVKINFSIYKNSSLFNKLFGITTQGNYYDGVSYNHINERDFHDLLMYYGIFGLIIELILPFYLLVKIIKKLIKNIKILWNDEIIILAIVISLMLFGSYLAGHCLFQPAVSIYLAYLVALFYKKVMG